MTALSHTEIWTAIDALAKRFDMSPSAMAKMAGLDPTSFNRSKRTSSDAEARPRWPSTESLAKVLEATGVGFSEFAALTETAKRPPARGVPLLGFAQAGSDGFFDDAGFPAGEGWDEIAFPGLQEDGVYALEISGDSMVPVFRDGDRILVSPSIEPRRGDRVVVKTNDGEVMAKELSRVTARTIELTSLNRDYDDRVLERGDVAWIARILWASQ
ncbi:MAG: DNA-binding protein [Caulobacter sp. 12-67-6]|nr:MAG: DNA-binding protein [Caulobacter sp. 12-67-6]OYX67147.1 MAG: DNA-binding protein [Caulobacter sp. 32-67-35]OZA75607.1 MAG: DNA-binding protein [Caulobacter sp. 39-67-4]HQR89023.1 helix-turn-helix transcriptional regulator [Caulobacter sp.]